MTGGAMDHRAHLPATARPDRGSGFAAAVALALGAVLLGGCHGATSPLDAAPLAGAAIGGDFNLIDQHNHPRHAADFAGRFRVMYFGYTFCPDACPLDVGHLMQGYHAFAKAHPDRASHVVPVFVSIDPARDTPAALAQFTAAFGPELVGLTGSPAAIAAVAKEYALVYQKREAPAGSAPGAYLMDHSRAAYLMGPQGQPVALLPVDADGPAVAAELARWVP